MPALSQSNPILKAWNDAFQDLGCSTTTDMFPHEFVGNYPYVSSVDPESGKRSAAALEYGVPAFQRANLTMMTEVTAHRVITVNDGSDVVAAGVEVTANNGDLAMTITADKEVILCAGGYNSSKLLELSGIGDKSRLEHLEIPTVVDNPHVGENLQNHVMCGFLVEAKEGLPPGQGVQGLTFLPFLEFSGPQNQERRNRFWEHLAATVPPSRDRHSHHVVRDIFDEQDQAAASMYCAFTGQPNLLYFGLMSTIPFSRGCSHAINKDGACSPEIDPRLFSRPTDLEIMARQLITLIRICHSPALEPFIKAPQTPFNISDIEAAKAYLRENATMAYHPCGTASLLPRQDGGVVNEELIVYGTRNLRVADSSIFPLLTYANPMATVYAVAEKAANMIKSKMTA